MRPKFALITRAHGLPKTHKSFENLPKLRPIIVTTNIPYYGISKFLSNLLNQLTENQYIVKDYFTAANKVREIPKELFDHGYPFVSFDVESLFTSASVYIYSTGFPNWGRKQHNLFNATDNSS